MFTIIKYVFCSTKQNTHQLWRKQEASRKKFILTFRKTSDNVNNLARKSTSVGSQFIFSLIFLANQLKEIFSTWFAKNEVDWRYRTFFSVCTSTVNNLHHSDQWLQIKLDLLFGINIDILPKFHKTSMDLRTFSSAGGDSAPRIYQCVMTINFINYMS